MEERVIHIEWDGPHSLEQLKRLDQPRDRGLYKVYGHHPVYGSNVLVYIGQTCGQTFAARNAQHSWGGGSQEDRRHVEVYVGRLKGAMTPSRDEWDRQIELAERLLIHAHAPAYNSTNIDSVSESDPEVCNARVLNWGGHRDLHPEVSGLRWTKDYTDQAKGYKVYEAQQMTNT